MRRALALHFYPNRGVMCGLPWLGLSAMRIEVTEDAVEVRLAAWQRALGLMRNIHVQRADLSDVHVVEDAIAPAMAAGVKVGLRLPWLYFVARTIHLDEAFVVRRGMPAVSFAVHDASKLRRVFLSTRRAQDLARELGG